jgi:peptide/nickel transport system substrate-binding protein
VSGPRSRPFGVVAIFIVLSLVLAACGSSSKPDAGGTTTSVFSGTVPQGGKIVVGAEQEPDCLDWIGTCGGSQWGAYMALYETLPQVFRIVPKDGKVVEVPGAVLTGEPKLETDPVQKITYNIDPKAVWSDGVAISCADFQYTADQQKNGKDIYDQTGWVDIDTVTCPDPKTVVVTFQKGKTYAGWRQLFTANAGVLPSHLLKGKDRTAAMKDGYPWSGGPWIAKWNKGDSIVLTPNDKFWGPKPHLDQVTFKFQKNTAAEFQNFTSHQTDAIYPHPGLDVNEAVENGLPGAKVLSTPDTGSVEALWFNNGRAPFDSKPVRQAIGYSVDRDTLVEKLFGPLGVDKAANSLNPFVLADYSDQDAWAHYKLNLDKVDELMTGAGWKKGSDGIWAKAGKKMSFTIITTAGDKLRELTEQVLQPPLKKAGFDMKIRNTNLDNLLDAFSKGNYDLILIAQTSTSIAPGLCSVMCTENIPGPANDNSGNNWSYASVPAADVQMRIVDSSLDDAARREAAKKSDDLLADANVALPLDPLPNTLIWNENKIIGPIQDNAIEGMFWNIDQWGLKK